jgi:hypothetical protein
MKVSHNGASKLSNAARIMRETSLPNAVLPKSTRLTDCHKFSTDGVFVYEALQASATISVSQR